jgi:nickel/cobalt exporter
MAATLTAAGLVLVRVRDRLKRRQPAARPIRALLLKRGADALPYVTACLVIVVGISLAARSLNTF